MDYCGMLAGMGGKILVAEDDPEARELLLLLLEGGEYSVLEAADGMEALDLLRTEQPDLLITDIVMPRMDGYELVRRLREDDRTAHTSVIFCSASYHEREVREMARSLGVQSTLAKPFDFRRFAARSMLRPPLAAVRRRLSFVATPAASVVGGAQERFVRWSHSVADCSVSPEPQAIVESTCHAARDILLAQCAQLVIADGEGPRHAQLLRASGERSGRSTAEHLHVATAANVGAGRVCAVSDVARNDSGQNGGTGQPGDSVSMLGVPVALGQSSLRLPVRHQPHRI
jgi:CheY-like chemotaxis protein